MTSQIKPKTLFCLVTLIAFAGMLSLFSVKYFLETEKTKAEILKNIERNKVETDKLYQSVLDRIELQVNRKNTYTPENIHEIIVDHYGLLQINNFRYTGMDLFWLSNKPEPTIIRRMGIEHYAENSEVFKQQEKKVEEADASPMISDQKYIICRKILSQNKVIGNICIIQNINDTMLQVISKKLNHRFMIGVSFNLGQVKFSVTNITPISHYFYYLLNYIICFVIVFIALCYAFVKYSKTVKSRDEQHKKSLAAIQKKCCCSDYLVSEVLFITTMEPFRCHLNGAT